jgi:radical SAM superfamily enzyme
MEEYVQLLADFLERLPPHIVIERISGDAPPRDLIAPQWVLDKGSIRKRLIEVLEERDTYQGAKYAAAGIAAVAAPPNSPAL